MTIGNTKNEIIHRVLFSVSLLQNVVFESCSWGTLNENFDDMYF